MRANRKDDAAVSKNEDRRAAPAEDAPLREMIQQLNQRISELEEENKRALERQKQEIEAAFNQRIAQQQGEIDFMLARSFLGSNDLITFFPYTVKDIDRIHWDNLVREKTPDVYKVVCEPIFDPVKTGNDCDYSVATAESDSSGRRYSGEESPTAFGKYIAHAESAHLLSAGRTCWPYFAFSAVPFLGKDVYDKLKFWIENPDQDLPEAQQKVFYGLINGIKPRGSRSKKQKTGLKNSIVNRIRLPLQGVYFDKKPRIMFLPILTLEKARIWNGEGYKAVFFVNTNAEDAELPEIVSATVGILDRSRLRTLQDVAQEANHSEIFLFARACEFLKEMLLGLVYCTAEFLPDKRLGPSKKDTSQPQSGVPAASQGRPPKSADPDKDKSTEQNEFLKTAELLRGKETKISVPSPKPDCLEQLRDGTLLVVEFGDLSEADARTKPLAPDPMLLGMKSAVNYLRFHDKLRILPACSPLDDVDSMDSGVSGDGVSLGSSELENFDLFEPRHFMPVDDDSKAFSVPDALPVTPCSELEDDEISEMSSRDE